MHSSGVMVWFSSVQNGCAIRSRTIRAPVPARRAATYRAARAARDKARIVGSGCGMVWGSRSGDSLQQIAGEAPAFPGGGVKNPSAGSRTELRAERLDPRQQQYSAHCTTGIARRRIPGSQLRAHARQGHGDSSDTIHTLGVACWFRMLRGCAVWYSCTNPPIHGGGCKGNGILFGGPTH